MLKTHVLGQSVEGRTIHVHELANDAPAILVVAGVHGDEPQSSFLADCLLELLNTRIGEMMDEHLVLIPRLNPDGLEKCTRKNAHGVDLNRNFPTANWKLVDSQDAYYGGPQAGSEPETQLFLTIFRRFQPKRVLAIHCIDDDRKCVNYDGPAKVLAEKMALENHYPVKADIGHATPGSMGIWIGYERKVPIVTLELPVSKPEEDCWQENRDAVLSFIQAKFA